MGCGLPGLVEHQPGKRSAMTDRDSRLADLVAKTREAEADPDVRKAHARHSQEVAAKLEVFTDLDQER